MARATRPYYYANNDLSNLAGSSDINFEYFSGFSKEQKIKSIESMHREILAKFNNAKILEISKASTNYLGQKLSAFNLTLNLNNGSHDVKASVERFFQGSKKFQNGGPFEELFFDYTLHPKRYEMLKESGDFIGFELFGKSYSTTPTTYFYDWLYITALKQNKALAIELSEYEIFTDIEFNPKKSFSCQAKSVALFLGLQKAGMLEQATKDADSFLEFYKTQIKKDELFSLFSTS